MESGSPAEVFGGFNCAVKLLLETLVIYFRRDSRNPSQEEQGGRGIPQRWNFFSVLLVNVRA